MLQSDALAVVFDRVNISYDMDGVGGSMLGSGISQSDEAVLYFLHLHLSIAIPVYGQCILPNRSGLGFVDFRDSVRSELPVCIDCRVYPYMPS